MSDPELARLIRNGTTQDRNIGIDEFRRRTTNDMESLFAVIDVLPQLDGDPQERCVCVLAERELMPTAAWKLGYELRERRVYSDERVMPLVHFIDRFADTPRLGKGSAQRAIAIMRQHLNDDAAREVFEERLQYFTRAEATVGPDDFERRRADKRTCNECGVRQFRKSDIV